MSLRTGKYRHFNDLDLIRIFPYKPGIGIALRGGRRGRRKWSPRGGRNEEDDGSDGSGDGPGGGSDDRDPRFRGADSDFEFAPDRGPGGPDRPPGEDDAALRLQTDDFLDPGPLGPGWPHADYR